MNDHVLYYYHRGTPRTQAQAGGGGPEERLKGWKRVLFIACTNYMQSTSQIVEALPDDLRNKPNALKHAQRNLRDMETDGLIEQDRQSIGEAMWRLSHT